MWAGNAFHKQRGSLLFCTERQAACTAKFIIARLKAMTDRHPLVEDKALALPQAVFLGHVLEILQDTALEVIDLIIAKRAHVGCRLFAADSAGTEHGNLALAMQSAALGPLLLDPFRKLGETRRFRVDGTLERADLVFVVVPGID